MRGKINVGISFKLTLHSTTETLRATPQRYARTNATNKSSKTENCEASESVSSDGEPAADAFYEPCCTVAFNSPVYNAPQVREHEALLHAVVHVGSNVTRLLVSLS